jgi:hypothetical protein
MLFDADRFKVFLKRISYEELLIIVNESLIELKERLEKKGVVL